MVAVDAWQLPRRSLPLKVFSGTLTGLRQLIMLVILLLFVAPLALNYFENPRKYAATSYLFDGRDYIMRNVGPEVRKYVPTRISGADRTDWVIVVGLLVVAMVAGSIRRRAETSALRRGMRKNVENWKRRIGLAENSEVARELESKISGLQNSGNLNRQELLKLFAETKRKLDSMGREVAFLSVDVVGSTAMKQSEDSASVQYDFDEYRKLVENVLKARGALKSAWTPDGVMVCFSTLDEAIQAGKDIIRSLVSFNRDIKLMKQDFTVRCGVNAGYVHFDDAAPLETISDRVIDIAGHMQKYAEPNTVAVARKIVEPLRQSDGFSPTDKVVDGYEVSAWRFTA
jgi:class 3 adenylate cyclase